MRNITPPPAITPRYKLPLPAVDVPFSALGGAWRMLPMERGPSRARDSANPDLRPYP